MKKLQYDTDSAIRIAANPYQGSFKKVLCVCSAGVLRSPTAALVLSHSPFNYNTRSAGIEHYALVQVSEPLLHWADEIVCMDHLQMSLLNNMAEAFGIESPIINLEIPDLFPYRDQELQIMVFNRYVEHLERIGEEITLPEPPLTESE